ncbi:MAG: 50S ribosomal protein L32e [Archaeoglobaceae archaeon]
MTEVSRLLNHRRRQKARKPDFRRIEAHKKLKLRDKSWRKPRGRHNKFRERVAGRKIVVSGYGTPRKIRGLHPSGYWEVLINNPDELESVNASEEAVRIASTVGVRKRLEIEKKAKEKDLKILNPVVPAEEEG